jgi:hypothetical protein
VIEPGWTISACAPASRLFFLRGMGFGTRPGTVSRVLKAGEGAQVPRPHDARLPIEALPGSQRAALAEWIGWIRPESSARAACTMPWKYCQTTKELGPPNALVRMIRSYEVPPPTGPCAKRLV